MKALAALLLLGISSASTDCSPEWCTPPYNNRLEQVIECAMQGVPEQHMSRLEDEGPGLLHFLPVDGYRVTGLNSLRRQGDLRTCCRNETQVVSFDLVSEHPIVCTFFWNANGNGSLQLAVQDVKVTTHARFIAASSNDSAVEGRRVLDEHEEPVGTTLRTGSMTINITETSQDTATSTEPRFMRLLALSVIQDTWEDLFVRKLVESLKNLSVIGSS